MESASSTTRNDALEEAAAFCEMYGEERLAMGGDSILADPILSGGAITKASLKTSHDLTIDGCIHSAGYHAAMHIAAHLRSMKTPLTGPDRP